jgi:hypothetical protein
LKKQLNEQQGARCPTPPPSNTLHAEIINLKNKQEEIRSQQPPSNMKQKHISTHGHRLLEAGIKSLPPLAMVEEVVQAKLMEERTRQAWELNLKVRGLPLPLPSSDPMVIGTSFLRDNLDLQDVTLDRAWIGSDSTLFLDSHLWLINFGLSELSESCFLFQVRSSSTKISPDHRLWSSNAPGSRLQQHTRQGNGQVIRTSKQSSRTLFHLGGYHNLGLPNDGPVGRGNREHAFLSVIGMKWVFLVIVVYYMMLLGHRTSYSLPRCMRAMFDLSRTLQDTISFQSCRQETRSSGGIRGSSGVACFVRESLWSRISLVATR